MLLNGFGAPHDFEFEADVELVARYETFVACDEFDLAATKF